MLEGGHIMNPIFSIFKFLWDDLKTDIITIKRIFTERDFFETRVKVIWSAIRSLTINDYLVFVFPLLLFIALGYFSGYFVAAKHYEALCNQHIYDTFYASKEVFNPINFTGLNLPN